MRQNLRLALLVSTALTLGPFGWTLYQYFTRLDISTLNHVELVQTVQVLVFQLLPLVSVCSLTTCLLIAGALMSILYPSLSAIRNPQSAIRNGEALPLPDKPSIVVLPFVNMSGDPEQEYFSDGLTEDLITNLSKVSVLFVIARNSAFTYKGKAVKVAIRVSVREVYLHCARSFRRARLWDPAARVPRKTLPSLATMVMEMAAMNLDETTSRAIDERVEESMKKLYY